MKYLFCVLLALSLAACGKETEDPGLSREEFLDFFPLHEHGEVYVEPFYVRFYYPGGNCLLFPTFSARVRRRRYNICFCIWTAATFRPRN